MLCTVLSCNIQQEKKLALECFRCKSTTYSLQKGRKEVWSKVLSASLFTSHSTNKEPSSSPGQDSSTSWVFLDGFTQGLLKAKSSMPALVLPGQSGTVPSFLLIVSCGCFPSDKIGKKQDLVPLGTVCSIFTLVLNLFWSQCLYNRAQVRYLSSSPGACLHYGKAS